MGIEASPAEFPPLLTDLAPVLHLTPAFAHRYEHEIVGSPLGYFKLRAGRDLRSFQLAVERLAAGKPVSFVSTRVNQGPKVQRSVHAEALALAVVAALVGLAGLVGVGQAMTRQTLAESDQLGTLRTLGMRDAQLRTLVVVRLLGIALVGMILAGALAVFGSQYALLPLARKAELRPGAHVDLVVLVCGAVLVLGLALLIALWSAYLALRSTQPSRARRAGEPAPTPRRVGFGGALSVFPLPTTLGVQFAVQRARRAVPAWATMVAVGLAVSVLAGALTFTANLQRLLNDPHRYGWNWDVKIGAPGLPDFHAFLLPTLTNDPRVSALSSGTVTQVDVGRGADRRARARPGARRGAAHAALRPRADPARRDRSRAAHAACARRARGRHDRGAHRQPFGAAARRRPARAPRVRRLRPARHGLADDDGGHRPAPSRTRPTTRSSSGSAATPRPRARAWHRRWSRSPRTSRPGPSTSSTSHAGAGCSRRW